MKKVLDTTPSDCELTKNEKIQVITTMVLSTLFAWLVFNAGWKNKLPTKVAQVNKYLKNMTIGLVVIGIIGVLISVVMVALSGKH